MVPSDHRIVSPVAPAAETPLRRIMLPFIVHTTPSRSTMCSAGGTTVPSADAGGRTVTTAVAPVEPPTLVAVSEYVTEVAGAIGWKLDGATAPIP